MAKKRPGICLTVGVNTYDHASPAYQSVSMDDLHGCVPDSNAIQKLATAQKFPTITQLTEDNALRQAVMDAIDAAAAALKGTSGLFVFHFSGHGMRGIPGSAQTDSNGQPISCMLMHDAPIASFELYDKWSSFDEGVRILVLSDSCHSGQITKAVNYTPRNPSVSAQAQIVANSAAFFSSIKLRAASAVRIPTASVVLISGCGLNETSGDLGTGGLFTSTLVNVWNDGDFNGDYDDFHQQIQAAVSQAATTAGANQTPQLFFVGAHGVEQNMALFLGQDPFSI